MDRKHLFKRKSEAAKSMREKRRRERRDSYKKHRDEMLMGKRMKRDESEAVEEEIAEQQVVEMTQQFINCKEDVTGVTRKLRNTLSLGTAIIDSFLSVDGAMQRLVDLLNNGEVETKLEAAWCLNNIASGTEAHAMAVLNDAGDILIGTLSSGNVPLEDQCAWAIGNLAAGNAECRNILRSKGAIEPLVSLLKSSTSSVVHCAAYALSNLARDKETTNMLTDAGILPHLAVHLVYNSDELKILAEVCWVLTYLTACGTHEKEVLEAGILEKLIDLVVTMADKDADNVDVLTPLLRSLGNVICSGLEEVGLTACRCKELFPALDKLLDSEHQHIRKECLWVLSNMTATAEACNELREAGLFTSVIKMLGTTFDVKKEAAYTLCNVAAHGDEFCRQLFDSGALKAMIPLLKSKDVDTIHYALSFVEMLLHSIPETVKAFEDDGGLAGLETLEYTENEMLRSQTDAILDTYYYKEDPNGEGDVPAAAESSNGEAAVPCTQ